MFSWLGVEKMLQLCSLKENRQEDIIVRLMELENSEDEFDLMEIESLIEEIKTNQFDPITHGNYYNQTDIRKHLKKLK